MDHVAVLLVDDESDENISLGMKLSQRGMHIRRVSTEKGVVLEIAKKQIDVVVLNNMMSGLNGFETLKRIKEMDPLVEVILFADRADFSLAIQGMELGAFDYILTSISAEELVYKLMDAYRRKSLQEEKIKNLKKTFDQKMK
jgi:DNA-binding NtrC family response regulator